MSNDIEYRKMMELGGRDIWVTDEAPTVIEIYETWTHGPSGSNRRMSIGPIRTENQTTVDYRGFIEAERPESRLWGKVKCPKGSVVGIAVSEPKLYSKNFPGGLDAADVWYHAEHKECGLKVIKE